MDIACVAPAAEASAAVLFESVGCSRPTLGGALSRPTISPALEYSGDAICDSHGDEKGIPIQAGSEFVQGALTLQYLEPEPDDFGLAEEELLVDGPIPALEEHGVMAEEAPIEAWHWRKARFSKTA